MSCSAVLGIDNLNYDKSDVSSVLMSFGRFSTEICKTRLAVLVMGTDSLAYIVI